MGVKVGSDVRVFENRMLRGIFRTKRDEVTECWRKLLNEELHNLYSSPNIIRIIKSSWMKRAGHVARMGEKMISCRILIRKPERNRPPGRLFVDVKIILKLILEDKMGWYKLD
jgi:hypothetical protein